MQAIDIKHIKIGHFVQELWNFEDKGSKLEWENKTLHCTSDWADQPLGSRIGWRKQGMSTYIIVMTFAKF